MGSRRKTVCLRDLIEQVNHRNRHSTCPPDLRNGWNSMLEQVLMDANVYAGFGYLRADQVPEGHLPGCEGSADKPGSVKFPDESRRAYHIHRHLTEE